MRYLPDGVQMKRADEYTIRNIGIPSVVLMERAALQTVAVMRSRKVDVSRALVVCGSGNNGGDGFAVARLLTEGLDEKAAARKAEKMAIEDARFVLPNACTTKMIVTMNARSLLNFFSHRCCNRAQWEIRDVAWQMLEQVKEVAPHLFEKAGPPCLKGPCPEGKMTCGKREEVRRLYEEKFPGAKL